VKVAMVSEHASPLAAVGGVDAGGQNVHVAELAAALARHGAEVVVHTRRDDPELPRRVRLAPGVVVDHIDAGPAAYVPKDDLLGHMTAFATDLARAWSGDPPDVVHSHFWMSGLAALDAAAPFGFPIAHTFHALGVVKRRHQGTADTSPRGRLRLERDIVRRVDRVIATCSDEVRELRHLGAQPSRVSVVPCGVDLGRFTEDGPVEEREPCLRRIVVVGRLVPRKGTADVIRALAAVPEAELVVAGGPAAEELGQDHEAQRLRQLAVELGVQARLVLRGAVLRPDVPALLRSADVVVCAPWYEPFGIVPLEGMACGVPVIASAVGGLTDTVVDGVTGLHVPPRDPLALAEALRWLLERPDVCAAMGAAGARRARKRYGWDTVARATLEAYTELALGRREVVGA